MKTIHLTINLIRAETAEERTEREHLAMILRCMTAAIVAVAVLAIVLAWRGITLSRAVIRESQQVTSKLTIATATADTGFPITGLDKPCKLTAADLYAVEYDNRVNPSQLTDAEWEALLEACEENRIAPSLALGLIQVESSFDPGAISSAGCYGYTQINPRWHPANLAPVENIRYGIGYLAECIARYDNLEAGLTAYNAGHDTGSRRYANRVLAAAEEWEGK